jgi:hypothetical protein
VMVIQGVSLGHLHVYIHVCIYVCITCELVHLVHYSPFYVNILLVVISTDLTVPYLYLYKKYINHTHLFVFFICPPTPISALPLVWPILHSCPSLFRCPFIVHWGFLPWYFTLVNVLCLCQYNLPPPCFLTLSLLSRIVQQFSVVSCAYTGVIYFDIISYISFLLLQVLILGSFWH